MLVIRWKIPWTKTETIVSWFISNDNIVLVTYTVGFIFGFIVVNRFLDKKEAKKIVLQVQPGGVDIANCLDPSATYEVLDRNLEKAIRALLNQSSGLLFVSPPVAILAYQLLQQPAFALRFLGLEIMTNNVVQTLSSSILPPFAGMVLGGFGSLILHPLLSALSPLALVLAIGIGMGGFHQTKRLMESDICQQIVRILPTVSTSSNPNKNGIVLYTDTEIVSPNSQTTFISNAIDQRIYTKEQIVSDCEILQDPNSAFTLGDLNVKQKPIIRERCKTENKYVPLNQRTKTLKDLQKYDDSSLRQSAQKSVDTYNNKAEQFRAKRMKIQENRKNDQKLYKITDHYD